MVVGVGPDRILVLVAGVGGAVVDLAVAAAYWAQFQVDPIRSPQGIAAWFIGQPAYAGGTATAWFGLLAYCALMCGACALYQSAARRWSVLRRRPWVYGSAYGALAYGVIFWIASPLLTGETGSTRPDWIALCVATYVVAERPSIASVVWLAVGVLVVLEVLEVFVRAPRGAP